MPEQLLLGLRFPRSQVRRLREIVEQLRSDRPDGIDIGLFEKAADSAIEGEPLQVRCSSRAEIELIADGFTRWGVRRPEIDELNGSPA
jgi:hypothetical protein